MAMFVTKLRQSSDVVYTRGKHYREHCIPKLYSVQCTVYSLQCTVDSVQFTVYSVRILKLSNVHSKWGLVHLSISSYQMAASQ